jgi:hypothetical protein
MENQSVRRNLQNYRTIKVGWNYDDHNNYPSYFVGDHAYRNISTWISFKTQEELLDY